MINFTGLLILSVVALCVPLLFLAAWRQPIVGFGLALISVVVLALVLEFPSARIMGFNVSPFEGLFGLLGLIGLIRLFHRRHAASLPSILILSLSLLFAFALLRGISSFGFDYGRLDFRVHFLFITGILFGASMPMHAETARRSASTALMLAVASLVTLAVIRLTWLPSPFGSALHAADGLLLGQVFVVGLLAWSRGLRSALLRTLLVILAPVVLLLQIRTVWLAALAGLALFAFLHPFRFRKIAIVGLTGLIPLVLLSNLGLDPGRPHFQRGTVFDSLSAAAADDGSWEWRRTYWENVLEDHLSRGPVAAIVGAGYGQEWERPSRQVTHVGGPHNFYIELFVRFGLLGLVVFLGMYICVLVVLFRNRTAYSGTLFSNEALMVILVMQLAFYIPFGPTAIQGVFFGMATASILVSRVRPKSEGLAPVSQADRRFVTP